MEEILKRGEAKGRPTGPADLGFFQSESGKQNADNVFILVVHYDFKKKKKLSKLLYRPKKETLLDLLGNQEKLLRLFSSKDIPSVFVLFFLSHGNENGVIYTDDWNEELDDFISFSTEEIFNSLKKLDGFEKSLKIVNFGPCRGELDDAKFDRKKDNKSYDSRNSCRITSAPEMPNTVIIYSTVETTMANTSERGSWFVNILCDVLNQISEDKLLLLALTSVQHKMHKESIAGPDFATNLHLGQTPEVKMFPLDRSFSFSRPLTTEKSVSRTDSRMGKAATITSTSEFFSWKSDEGQNIRGRRAFIFFERQTREVQETEKALRQNLDFETRFWKLENKSLNNCYKQVGEMEHDVGCVLTCIFCKVSEKERTREVCVLVSGEEKPIADILYRFIGPENDRFIGKPKIFFIIDQKTQECDSHSRSKSQFEVFSTNHSGWLVMILKDKDLLEQLIGIFKGNELKKGKSLQELLVPLITTKAKIGLTMLNSTLQYLLDFPDWPRTFVKPDFELGNNRKKIGFDDQIKEENILRENQKRVIVFLDGFDEICPHSRDKVLAIVRALKQRRVPLCVATRPHEAKVIKEAVGNVTLVQIQPFNEAKQIEFLRSLTDKNEDEIKRVLHAVKQIGFTSLKGANMNTILVSPLHLSLVAQCSGEGNLFQIYDKVVRKKVEMCLVRENDDKEVAEWKIESALHLLRLIAFRFLKNEPLVGPGVTREDLAKMNDYGVATVEQETVTFLHHTFAEFLAAQYFLKNVEESSTFDIEFIGNENMEQFRNAIRSEEIAIELLKMNVIDSQTLGKYIDWILEEIATYNAISVFNQLKKTFPNKFIELLRKSECSAGCTAVYYDNDDILGLFLENGFNVNFTFHAKCKDNALAFACYLGRLKSVQILFKYGAKQAIMRSPFDNSLKIWDPLNLAVQGGHLEVVKHILQEELSGLARDEVTF
ncbi:Hypothetical predicted protein [Cloeon dipterum]|uniref:Caspase family p10 domain-containing protein n=1 Tax=Cloeon dipterum TaxID=197152 RepID=A0A8S1DZU6_9INSE|nr:Hypothetical predicted protein [Cloeon dipterum]